MSDSVRPHRRQPTRLRCPWDSPGKNTGMGCHFLLQWVKVKSESEVAQSCPTLSDPMDCSPPGSSVHGFSRQEYWSGVPLPSNTPLFPLWNERLPQSVTYYMAIGAKMNEWMNAIYEGQSQGRKLDRGQQWVQLTHVLLMSHSRLHFRETDNSSLKNMSCHLYLHFYSHPSFPKKRQVHSSVDFNIITDLEHWP